MRWTIQRWDKGEESNQPWKSGIYFWVSAVILALSISVIISCVQVFIHARASFIRAYNLKTPQFRSVEKWLISSKFNVVYSECSTILKIFLQERLIVQSKYGDFYFVWKACEKKVGLYVSCILWKMRALVVLSGESFVFSGTRQQGI